MHKDWFYLSPFPQQASTMLDCLIDSLSEVRKDCLGEAKIGKISDPRVCGLWDLPYSLHSDPTAW